VDLRRKRGKQEAQAYQRASTKPIDHDGRPPKVFLCCHAAFLRTCARSREATRSKPCSNRMMRLSQTHVHANGVMFGQASDDYGHDALVLAFCLGLLPRAMIPQDGRRRKDPPPCCGRLRLYLAPCFSGRPPARQHAAAISTPFSPPCRAKPRPPGSRGA
jgi:hypothetical protein